MERLLSQLLNYDIININDGNKYGTLRENQVAIDKDGKFKLLIIKDFPRILVGLPNDDSSSVPWDSVKRIGVKTIIIDV